MRHVRLLLYPCTVLLFALPAVASSITGQISIGGYAESTSSVGMGSAAGINFASANASSPVVTGTSGDLYSFAGGSGSFAGLSCASISGACGTIEDIANFSTEGAVSNFLTFTTGGPAVSFDLTSIESVLHTADASGGSVTFIALGQIELAGYDSTPGALLLTAQGNNIVSFSGTLLSEPPPPPAPTPEPGSLVLLAGPMALGFAQRRRLLKRRA